MIMRVKILTKHSFCVSIYKPIICLPTSTDGSSQTINLLFLYISIIYKIYTLKIKFYSHHASQDVRKCSLLLYVNSFQLKFFYLKDWDNKLSGHNVPLTLFACWLENNLTIYRKNNCASFLPRKIAKSGNGLESITKVKCIYVINIFQDQQL